MAIPGLLKLTGNTLHGTRRGPLVARLKGLPYPQGQVPTTYTYLPSGGLVFGGSAPISKEKSVTPSGVVVFSGSALVSRVKAFIASGGIVLSGSASILKEKVPTASGGVAFGGAASTAYVPGATGPSTFSYTGSGSITLAGSALSAFESAEIRAVPTVDRWRVIPHGLSSVRAYRGRGGFRFQGAARTALVRARRRLDEEHDQTQQIAKEIAAELIHRWERECEEDELLSLACLLD